MAECSVWRLEGGEMPQRVITALPLSHLRC